MNIQALLDAMSNISRATRSDYHMTLGELVKALEQLPADMPVSYDEAGGAPGEASSYRGYYADLAFEDAFNAVTVAEFLAAAKGALNSTFEGYKGGDFEMGPDAPLWRSECGVASGIAIIGINADHGVCAVLTKNAEGR